MSNILVLNSGSTSIKFKVYSHDLAELQSGHFENVSDYNKTMRELLRDIKNLDKISVVGHRVVHGGTEFKEAVLLNDEILLKLDKISDLAPLHMPYNLMGIKIMQEYLPNISQVLVFDTSFFNSLPDYSRLYALPLELQEKLGLRRFGFHGISHKYLLEQAQSKLSKSKINLITCHLGGGWSVSAIRDNKPVDTSMGFTPLEGLTMMTRSGDIDAGLVLYLIDYFEKNEGLSTRESCDKVSNLLNSESGIKGLSGGVDNYKELLKRASLGEEKSSLAINFALKKLSKYIAAYWLELGGKVDALVLSGGIGSGDKETLRILKHNLKPIGDMNILQIKTDEEKMIAKETLSKFQNSEL